MVGGVPLVQLAAEHWLAAGDLSDHGVQVAAGRVESAVGGVVAEPGDLGDGGVVVGESQGGHFAAHAVDEQPGAALPDPARCPCVATCIRGEGVIQPDGAADNKASISDVVSVAGGPLLHLAVDDEGSNAEIGFIFAGAGGVSIDGVWDFAGGSESNRVRFGMGERGSQRKHQYGEARFW